MVCIPAWALLLVLSVVCFITAVFTGRKSVGQAGYAPVSDPYLIILTCGLAFAGLIALITAVGFFRS